MFTVDFHFFLCYYKFTNLIQRKRRGFMENKNSFDYFDQMLQNSKSTKKQVALYLDDAKIEEIDMVSKQFSLLSDARSFSRNTLIESAIDKFLNESKDYLLHTCGVDVDALLEEERSGKFDTVIFSAHGRGFEDTFLGEAEPSCWYSCRVSEARRSHLKYIAIYRGQPISAITHYAKIKEFQDDVPDKGTVCYFEGAPIELPHKIVLGSKPSCFFNGTKYTQLESLLNATQADKLIFG